MSASGLGRVSHSQGHKAKFRSDKRMSALGLVVSTGRRNTLS